MTAVAVDYVRSGFAIAADARAHWRAEVAEEKPALRKAPSLAQKIFKVHNRGRSIAYALTGTVYNDDLKFSLVAKAKRAAESLANASFDDPRAYIRRFSIPIKEAYEKARNTGRFKSFSEHPSDAMGDGRFVIARIIFAGYFDREPFIGVSTILHGAQIVGDVLTEVWQPIPGTLPLISGSSIVPRMMFETVDPHFEHFVVPLRRDSSLEDSIARAKGCIEAQCSDYAAEIDPFCREQVGGPVHIATVTPESGFQWSVRPAELI